MKKSLFSALAVFLFSTAAALADDSGDFYEDLLITDEVRAEENSDIAVENARRLLDEKPQLMQIKNQKIIKLPQRKKNKTADTEEQIHKYGPAPFGLFWGASVKNTRALGVELRETGQKDYVNSYTANLLPKPLKDFRTIVLTFGEEDELWRIIAYGRLLKDNAQADKVMEEYNKFYKLLDTKYGNARQFYTPKVTNVDKTVDLGKGKTQTVTEKREEPIGGENFLKELQSGEAVLYATFENGKVGAALAVNVDGDGRSYITVDYRNLQILKDREQAKLDAL